MEGIRVLILDTDEKLLNSYEKALAAVGAQALFAPDVSSWERLLKDKNYDCVLCSLESDGASGMVLLEKARSLKIALPIILLAESAESKFVFEVMDKGAYDLIAPKNDVEHVVNSLKKAVVRERLKLEFPTLKRRIKKRSNYSEIISQSPAMVDIFSQIERLAPFKTTILISGESGTGKELLARAVHNHSPRRKKAFVPINCGAIPENLMESELFGHKKGSFTDATRDKKGLFEEADGGTIFLDEIGELPVHLQVKLLRALQEQQIRPVGQEESIDIDVRVLAATHRDLEDDVMTGRFREDLFYRLNVVSMHLPALRERPDDIPLLVEHFVQKHNRKLGLEIKDVDSEALECMLRYRWRGNIRELENCIERAMVLADGDTITEDLLPLKIRETLSGVTDVASQEEDIDTDDLSVKKRVRNLETSLILKALQKTGGNRTHAAKILEISHRTLLYKLKEYGLSEVEK
ncbi:MAG: sigma-54-dependent Fis family transcriptional regulator [Bdellovibrionales bacterium]|nr:sigma-54-dependent Fis family transcriptional regulator [Bdellovibrionales bacterium]